MKTQLLKRILCSILTAAMIFASAGTAVIADSGDVQTEEIIPPEAQKQTVSVPDEAAAALPEVFDPRPDGVSPIRDQYWGTCWAQAGIAAAEVFLIHNGLEDSSYQLSVEDVLWRSRDEGHGGWILPDRETSGFPPTITGYLTTAGVRLEKDIPYFGEPSDGDMFGSVVYETGENQKPAAFETAPVQYEITDMIYLKEATPEQVKKLILKYGAIGASYKAAEESFNEKTSAAWEPFTGEGSNHSVAVVGWDDTFPKENFIEKEGLLPQADGAWIVKNSFGTGYGSDDGYIYISYEDGYLFHETGTMYYIYAVTKARKPSGQKRYMHDQYGAIRTIEKNEKGTSVWANVFEFGKNERISELSFVSWAAGSSYKLYYAPMDGEVPSADRSSWHLLAEGTIEDPGYITAASRWKETVPAGRGAVLFEATGKSQSIGTDEPGYTDFGGRLKFNPISDKGTAFELKEGKFIPLEVERTINDLTYTEYPDLCIRAYTLPSGRDRPARTDAFQAFAKSVFLKMFA